MRPAATVDPRRIPSVPHGGMPPPDPDRSSSRSPGVDLSLSVNPYGPPPYLREAVSRALLEVTHYPDREQRRLTAGLARALSVPEERLLVAGSASELIRATVAAYGPRRSLVLPQYTYEEYARTGASVGSRTRRVRMPDLHLDSERLAAAVSARALVMITNPATPTGEYTPTDSLAPVWEAAERKGALLVVDESYLPFVAGGESSAGRSPNLLTIASWSKTLGVPGLPLGHAIGDAPVLDGLRSQILPWNVGPFARHLGLLALERPAWARRTLRRVQRTAARTRRELRNASAANYFCVPVGDARSAAAALGREGFRVRDLTSLGLPQHIRFAVADDATTERFLSVLGRRFPGTVPGGSPLT